MRRTNLRTGGSAGHVDDSGEDGKRRHAGFSIDDPVRVLVLGNDHEFEAFLRTTLGRLRLSNNVETAFLHTLADARRVLGTSRVDLVLSEATLPDGTYADLLRTLEVAAPSSHGVILSTTVSGDLNAVGHALRGEAWSKHQSQAELRRHIEQLILMRTFARHSARRVGPASRDV